MNQQEARELLQELLNAGVEIEVKSFAPEKYEIKTEAKSNLYLTFAEDGLIFMQDRYSGVEHAGTKNAVLSALAHCRYGRDYMSTNLSEYLVSKGYMQKFVSTSVSYE